VARADLVDVAAQSRFLPAPEVASLDEAYRWCQRFCRNHYENFPVASLFFTPAQRRGLAAVYAFARLADDIADEDDLPAAERFSRLNDWENRLKLCLSAPTRHAVFWALSDTMAAHRLTLDPFTRLLNAFRQDVAQNRYPAFDDVLAYCDNSANPVGELVLRIAGAWTAERQRWADAICTGLQLANFWQDVFVDARKDRIYIPQEDIARFGASPEQVLRGPATDPLLSLIKFQVERTWDLFESGRPLCDDAPRALRRHLRLVWLGGTRILEKIESQNYDVWNRRQALGWMDAAPLAARWIGWSW
jgi:squalene synthase HpnC